MSTLPINLFPWSRMEGRTRPLVFALRPVYSNQDTTASGELHAHNKGGFAVESAFNAKSPAMKHWNMKKKTERASTRLSHHRAKQVVKIEAPEDSCDRQAASGSVQV